MNAAMIVAPFSDRQVKSLAAFQASGQMHPFTCNGEHDQAVKLVPTRAGWVCPETGCTYTQNWAHAFIGQWLDLPPFGVLRRPAEFP